MSKGDQTRSKIIAAAIQIFNAEGTNWTSFQMLAKKVGISQPAIYIYFTDKDDLILACCLDVVQRGQAFIDGFVDPNAKPRDRLKSYIEGNLKWIMSRPKEGDMLLAIYSGGGSNKRFSAFHAELDKSAIQRLKTHLKKPNETQARTVHNLLVGEMIKAVRRPHELSLSARVKLILDVYDSMC